MIDDVSRRTRVSRWPLSLRAWGVAAEKLVFSLDDSHWTHSFALWVSLNVLDSALTWQGLSLGAWEANPFLRLAAQTYGDGYMIAGKMALALLIGMLVWGRETRRLKGLLNLGMMLVIIANGILLSSPMWLPYLLGL